MPRANDAVAELLQEYADLLLITGGDAFRARNYEKAAKSVAGYSGDVSDLDEAGLQKIPGVGKSIATKIVEYQQTGAISQLDELRTKIPDGVRAMTRIPALGPKRAVQLYTDLGISAVSGCERCEYAGSLRRFRETVGDIDILAAASDSGPLMQALVDMPEVTSVVARGETKTSVRVRTDHAGQGGSIQVDLRVIPAESWGAALQYFTGSQAHNVATREIAVRKKLKLSEYGLFEVETGNLIASATEEEVYQRLGMDWVPPPMREDTGEVQAAQRHKLPTRIQVSDIKGDLHSHTNLTDGVATLEQMVAKARALGHAYFAITDHAPNLFMQRMTLEKALEQREQVRKLESALAKDGGQPISLLHGTELNIGPDGSVDWPE